MRAMDVLDLKVGDSFVSAASGVTLKVAAKPVDLVGGFVSVMATQDGRGFERGVWHSEADGAEAESVWAEVWNLGGCQFHGCVDSVSRRVVQVG